MTETAVLFNTHKQINNCFSYPKVFHLITQYYACFNPIWRSLQILTHRHPLFTCRLYLRYPEAFLVAAYDDKGFIIYDVNNFTRASLICVIIHFAPPYLHLTSIICRKSNRPGMHASNMIINNIMRVLPINSFLITLNIKGKCRQTFILTFRGDILGKYFRQCVSQKQSACFRQFIVQRPDMVSSRNLYGLLYDNITGIQFFSHVHEGNTCLLFSLENSIMNRSPAPELRQ